MRLTTWCVVVCLAGSPAAGQLIPPPEHGAKVVTAQLRDGQVEMRDAANGAPLLLPKGIALWEDKNKAGSLASIQLQAQPTGFDLIYTYDNTGPNTRKLGALNLGIFTLGHRVDYPDLRQICEPLYADYEEGYKVRQMQYPDTLYSPAWVLQNQKYSVGVTLHYPIMDYKHSVRLCLYSPEGKYDDGEGGRGWRLEFLLSNVGTESEDNKLLFPGEISPGETRTYVISVRVTRKVDEWVRTMLPYRNWFRGEYGGISYKRQTRCVNGRSYSTHELCSDANPYGFGDSRPDLNGWGSVVSSLLERQGWDTLVLWTVSGSYRYSTDNNMPYQFATNWNATPGLRTAIDPLIGFPRLPAAGQKVGFWWGHSTEVADKWDDDVLEPFDPDDADHRKRALAEMDMAVAAGATTIGLDTFSVKRTPVWELAQWARDLKARYPGVRFCAEPVTCDLIHREIATFYRGNKDRWEVVDPEDINGFKNPHYLADFLLPGHEIWGGFRWAAYEEFGIYYTDEEKTQQLAGFASLGYVPCSMDYFILTDPTIEAAESWKDTVPPDLQIDDEQIMAPADLEGIETTKGTVTLTWTDTSPNETGFRVQRRTRLGDGWSAPANVASVDAEVTSWTDGPPQGAHEYRVKAFNSDRTSAWAPFAGVVPRSPGGLNAVNAGGNAKLTWTDRSNFEAQFKIERQQLVGGKWISLKQIAVVSRNAVSYTDAPGTGTWRYRIRAGNVCGLSAWTGWKSATLP